MPQASEDLRRRWGGPTGIDEDRAIGFLRAAGYRLIRGWVWVKPDPDHSPTEAELSAVKFLIDEWDFGGIVDVPEGDSAVRSG